MRKITPVAVTIEQATEAGCTPTRRRPCPYCAFPNLDPLYTVADHYGVVPGRFSFVRCRACGSAVLDPLPDAEVLGHAYPVQYTYKLADQGGWLRRIERAFYQRIYTHRIGVFRALTGLEAGRVLEVGCGSGHFLKQLADAGYDVEGLDVSDSDVAYGRERLGLRVHHGTLEDLDLPVRAWDVVVMHAVLEHVLDPAATITRVRALLRPGGVAVVAVPMIDSLQARWLRARWNQATEAPRHVTLPSRAGMQALFESTGFVDVRTVATAMLDNAGCIALSLLPHAATPLAYGARRPRRAFLARAAGAALIAPALAVAALERSRLGRGVSGTLTFGARKPGGRA